MAIEKTRAILVDVARRLFARKGLEETTMNDISQAAGKGRRTLYTYFKNKEEIFDAVVEAEMDRLAREMAEVASRLLSPEDKLVAVIYGHLEAIKEIVQRNGNMRAEFFRDAWRVSLIRKRFDTNEKKLLAQILTDGERQGYFDIENIQLAVNIIHYCLRGLEIPYIYGRLDNGLSPAASRAAVQRIIHRAIGHHFKKTTDMLLQGKTALITGAARGIGKSIALKFASEGANIAFTDLVLNDDMAAGLEATRKEIEALGVKCLAYAGNAADFAETEKVVAQIKQDFGTIDILVNNAGITKDGLMLRMSEQQWDAVINVNLKSAFNFIHACVPVMMRQRGGSIINMASVVGVHGNAGQANYAASKAGLIALAKSIAQEMGPKGIRANAIAPGFIETAMTAALPDEVREEWKKKIPLRRGGQVEDIANTALYLASDLSSYVSGQVIQVDGGMNM